MTATTCEFITWHWEFTRRQAHYLTVNIERGANARVFSKRAYAAYERFLKFMRQDDLPPPPHALYALEAGRNVLELVGHIGETWLVVDGFSLSGLGAAGGALEFESTTAILKYWVSCRACGGMGGESTYSDRACGACCGSGRRTMSSMDPPYISPTCNSCGGSGRFSSSTWLSCPHCGGSQGDWYTVKRMKA